MDRNLSASSVTVALCLLILAFIGWSHSRRTTSGLPIPPGPKPLPLIGNWLDFPTDKIWLAYNRWSQTYGDVVCLRALGEHIIVLDSAKAVSDLFERRSAIYSDRPRKPVLDIFGFDWTFVLARYGTPWRMKRRRLHEQIHQGVSGQYQGAQVRGARLFLRTLLAKTDEDINTLVRRAYGRTLMNIAYGVEEGTELSDRFIDQAEEVVRDFEEVLVPGGWLVDLIPALEYIPAWLPGGGFKKKALVTKRRIARMLEEPMEFVKSAIAAGEERASVASVTLEKMYSLQDHPEHDFLVNATAGNTYVAGIITTAPSAVVFFLAMLHYPEVMRKAQAELDSVVGNDRLPDFNDAPQLPYIYALVSEVMRWQPVLPLGFPHASNADDEYNGFLIPKGSIVIANAWAILHDPEMYPDPEVFRPERFLTTLTDGTLEVDKSVRDPRTVAFGYGRRICPGRFLAVQSLYSTMVSVLAAFDISPAPDKDGVAKAPPIDMSSGLLSDPAPFKCTLTPRSARAVELINEPLPDRDF